MDLSVYEELLIEESFETFSIIPGPSVYDDIITSESYQYVPYIYSMDVYDEVAVLFDIISMTFTPKFISVFDTSYLSEYISMLDIIIEPGINLDFITVTESIRVRKQIAFQDILRGYPFTILIQTGIVQAEFENGCKQQRDTWGRNRKQFEINFPVLTKPEALDIMTFVEDNIGKTFAFRNPIDEVDYTVLIVEPEFEMERSHYNTYFGKIVVEEVL